MSWSKGNLVYVTDHGREQDAGLRITWDVPYEYLLKGTGLSCVCEEIELNERARATKIEVFMTERDAFELDITTDPLRIVGYDAVVWSKLLKDQMFRTELLSRISEKIARELQPAD